MAHRPASVPTYRLHKPSGQAVATIRQADGSRKDVYLGDHGSPESRTAYGRLVAELSVSPLPDAGLPGGPRRLLTVDAVLLAFLRWAEGHYRKPDGTPTSQVHNIRSTIRVVRDGYELTPAVEFGPLALKAVRLRMVESGWSRSVVNQRVGLVKRIFRWAASEELVPVGMYTAIATVAGLQRGRTQARELPPVQPVEDAIVDATLPHLNRHVAGLVELQRLTGCRPGEACRIRRSDIDTCGAVWLYSPAAHKNSHRGKPRVIAIGPKAQAMLGEFFTPYIDDFLFSPSRAVGEQLAARGAKRVTPR